MIEEIHTATLTKDSQRNLGAKAVANQLRSITSGVNSRSLAHSGWTITPAEPSFTTAPYVGDHPHMTASSKLHFLLIFSRQDDKKPGSNDLAALARKLATKSDVAANGNWVLAEIDGMAYEATEVVHSDNVDNVGYADCEVPDDFDEYFAHLYGLDAPRTILRKKVESAIDSGWTNRSHAVLVGPPGCGKSDLAESLMRALGEDAVVRFDATSMTSNGFIKDLLDRDILPRIAIFEECEKVTSQEVTTAMLAVMDQRAEIKKTTARQNVQRDTHLLCIATVNDYAAFKKLNSGALASRFGKAIGFRRPSREMLGLILSREVEKIGGNEAWIDPTLDYCEEIGEHNPRAIIDICVTGRDDLLPTKEYPEGKYQRMLNETSLDEVEKIADWSTMEAADEGNGAQ